MPLYFDCSNDPRLFPRWCFLIMSDAFDIFFRDEALAKERDHLDVSPQIQSP